nr:MAG TPA: ReqiPepy6 protein [Caudoviricetes sp.]
MGSSDGWIVSSVFGHGRTAWNTAGFQFLAVSLTSGIVLAEFPDLQVSKLSYRFEETTSETVMLPWRNIPSNWVEATIPYGVAILLVRGSTVLWGGIVVKRERTLQGSGLSLTLATVEHYFDSVYVKDHAYSNRDQCEIVKDLVSTTLNGHRFMISVEASPSSIRRDRTYEESSDKTLLSVLQELSNVQNGPEWCTSWRNVDGRYVPVVTVADRIGSVTPVTTFDESVMTSFKVLEDYTTGYGANMVWAVGDATGEDRLRSDTMVVEQSYRPVVEHVVRPSSSITRKETLDAHASSSLRQLRDGTNTLSMTLSLLAAPIVYKEWKPGDVISWTVADDDGRFAGFDHGEARVVGYDIDFSGVWTITPVLQ